MENKEIKKSLQTSLQDKEMWIPHSLVLLLETHGVKTFGDLVNMTYQEIDSIKGFGRINTFKVCLRAQWFSPEAFYNSRLAQSIEVIDERRYSQYNVIHTAVARYKEYKAKMEQNELEI